MTTVRWVIASLLATAIVAPLSGQTVQYRSPAGVEYRSLRDTGAVARAEQALAADPRNVDLIVALGVAQSGAQQFREAIATFTRGLAIAPDNATLYRWRGHRHLSVREFGLAMADLTRGYGLDSLNYGILYHLGVLRFAHGDFNGAADAFRRGQQVPPNAGELAGSTDWLWMSLMRAGRAAEARAMLARRPDSLPVSNAYTQRLRLYRGEIGPDQVFTPADTAGVQVATLSYGIGNWYLVKGDSAAARQWFERAVRSGGWAAFGFIVAERELQRDEERRDERQRDEQRRDGGRIDTNQIVQAVEARMRSYLNALLALDVDRAFAHYLRDPAMHVWNDGVRHDYDSWVALSRGALGGFRSLEGAWGDLSVLPLGDDAAVASASFRERAVDRAGMVQHIRGAVTWVWVRRDGEWKIIHGHAVHLPPEN